MWQCGVVDGEAGAARELLPGRAIAGSHVPHTRHMIGGTHLLAELACGHQHQRLPARAPLAAREHAVQRGQQVGQRFAAAGARPRHNVPPFERLGDALGLAWGRVDRRRVR